ncbi:unnamed protein product [Cyclocybe aegerita]|uniref:Uncharacterized protein n=1 Tax=Cyclocybe aegerita TaxID=1973307 RepID=A0A8S0X943_CYCAE|nr:unnamed protein product [Cyclocybe aegerita]
MSDVPDVEGKTGEDLRENERCGAKPEAAGGGREFEDALEAEAQAKLERDINRDGEHGEFEAEGSSSVPKGWRLRNLNGRWGVTLAIPLYARTSSAMSFMFG